MKRSPRGRLDRDPAIKWWGHVYTNGRTFIRTTDGQRFPNFVALDTAGISWLIEGKADDRANDDTALRKKAAAEVWARAVRNEETFGIWRYMIATEGLLKAPEARVTPCS